MVFKGLKRAAALLSAFAVAVMTLTVAPAGDGRALFGAGVSAVGDVAIDETNFPDKRFRKYVADNFDSDGDGVLSDGEIRNVNTIFTRLSSSITTMKGIEFFSSLTYLDCGIEILTSLDVSNNTALEHLNCSSIKDLKSLDVSNNTALTTLVCSLTGVTSLDLSNNTALTDLHYCSNGATSLDVSNNTALEYLNCSNNQLTSLDLSDNTALTSFRCFGNKYNIGEIC